MQQETFSNKEHSLQIQESVHGKDVYIVQTGRGGPLGDSELVEVLTMVHTAKINSAASVTVVMPNYPFSRSDKVPDQVTRLPQYLIHCFRKSTTLALFNTQSLLFVVSVSCN